MIKTGVFASQLSQLPSQPRFEICVASSHSSIARTAVGSDSVDFDGANRNENREPRHQNTPHERTGTSHFNPISPVDWTAPRPLPRRPQRPYSSVPPSLILPRCRRHRRRRTQRRHVHHLLRLGFSSLMKAAASNRQGNTFASLHSD